MLGVNIGCNLFVCQVGIVTTVGLSHFMFFFTFLLFSGLVAHYTMTSADISDCKQALAAVTEVLGSLRSIIAELENTEKLIELQQDVGGVEELVKQGRVSVQRKVLGY